MPLIVSQPYKATTAVSTAAELLFVEASGGPINTVLYSIDPTVNKFTVLNKVPSLPSYARSPAYSPDGNWFALGTRYAPFLQLYRRSSTGDYTQVNIDYGTFPAPSTESAQSQPLSFSKNGRMCYADYTGGGLRVFDLAADGSTYVQIAYITAVPGGISSACISPDGQYIAVSTSSSTGAYLFKWNGTTYVRLTAGAQYGSSNPGAAGWLEWSKDGTYLFATTTDASYSIVWWRFTSDVATRVNYLAFGGGLRKFSLSPDNQYLAAYGAAANGALIAIYKWNGSTTLTNLNVPKPAGVLSGIAFSPNGLYVAISGSVGTANYQGKVYQRTGDSFALLPNNLQTNNSFGSHVVFRPI